MKILFVTNGFPPHELGGTEILARNIAKHLLRKGNEVTVFAPTSADHHEGNSLVEGVRVHRVGAISRNRFFYTYSDDAIDLRFANFLFELHPDVAIVWHTVRLSAGILDVLSKMHVPTVLFLTDFYYLCHQIHLFTAELQACDGPSDGTKCKDCIAATIQRDLRERETGDPAQLGRRRTAFMRKLVDLPTLIIAPSEFVKAKFVEFGVDSSRILVIPEGVDVKTIKDHYYPPPSGKLRFGYFGGNSELRGISIILDAFRSMQDESVELVLAGQGLGQPLTDISLPPNVRFLGRYMPEDAGRVLSDIDVLVVPSRCHESYNLLAREAFAVGLPVIVSDLPAQSDAVREGVDGLHFRASDASDLASKMLSLKKDRKLLEKLKQGISDVPDVAWQAEQLEEVFRKLTHDEQSSQEFDTLYHQLLLEQINSAQAARRSIENELVETAADPLSGLMLLYRSRPDLRSAFPEVAHGEYLRFLTWARDSPGAEKDDSSKPLAKYLAWYRDNPLLILQDDKVRLESDLTARNENIAKLQSNKLALESDLTARNETIAKLESDLTARNETIAKLQSDNEAGLSVLRSELTSREIELASIRSSVGYKIIRLYARQIDKRLPDETRRGEFRRIVTASLRLIANQGVKSFLIQSMSKIRKREFRILEPQIIHRDALYDEYLSRTALSPGAVSELQDEISEFKYLPTISVIMPVFKTEPRLLKEAVESVRGQIYDRWELCIVDDASGSEALRKMLKADSEQDSRIKVSFLREHKGISAASNEAISLATGEFVVFLDHDDRITPDALFEIVKMLNANPDLDFIYTDEDKIDERGIRTEPFFKPDWSPDLLLSFNYVPHFAVYRREMVIRLGGLRPAFDGSQDYDLTLRVTETTNKIGHVPKVLYSWRKISTSTALSVSAKPYARDAAKRALKEAMERRGIRAEVTDGHNLWYRVRYDLDQYPLVSIVVITRNRRDLLQACLQSVEAKTEYPNYEIIVVDQGSTEPDTLTYLGSLHHKIVRYDGPFNFAKINNQAIRQANGEYILLLNNDTEVLEPDWLREMVSIAHNRREVGFVGAKLLYKDQRVQHAGVVLGSGGASDHPFRGKPDSHSGYSGFIHVIRNCIAVTAACILIKKSVFEELGGFDERFAVGGNDVDLCLRGYLAGYLTVYTPYAVLYHHEGSTRVGSFPNEEYDYFREKWANWLERDPYYNKNLSLKSQDELFKIDPDRISR